MCHAGTSLYHIIVQAAWETLAFLTTQIDPLPSLNMFGFYLLFTIVYSQIIKVPYCLVLIID